MSAPWPNVGEPLAGPLRALDAGASVYDLRGISDSLDETDHLFGLIQFKVGTGGQAAEYLGEWDFPLNKLLHKALDIYMSRR